MISFYAAWLIGYLLQSTIIIGGALLVYSIPNWTPKSRERIGRSALVLTLIVAILGLSAWLPQWGPQLDFYRNPTVEKNSALPITSHLNASIKLKTTPSSPDPISPAALLIDPISAERDTIRSEGIQKNFPPPWANTWLTLLVFIWVAGASISLGHMFLGYRYLRQSPTLAVDPNSSFGMLMNNLIQNTPQLKRVPLRVSLNNHGPMALGLIKPEIRVPIKVYQLAPKQQRALLAHEAAHILRWDPQWRLFTAGLCAVFWIQPMLRILARRLEADSEVLADGHAVEHTLEPVALAKCLAEVATWNHPKMITAASMGGEQHSLVDRVSRLVEDRWHPLSPSKGTSITLTGLVVLTLLLACLRPSISSANFDPEPINTTVDSIQTCPLIKKPVIQTKPQAGAVDFETKFNRASSQLEQANMALAATTAQLALQTLDSESNFESTLEQLVVKNTLNVAEISIPSPDLLKEVHKQVKQALEGIHLSAEDKLEINQKLRKTHAESHQQIRNARQEVRRALRTFLSQEKTEARHQIRDTCREVKQALDELFSEE